MADPYWDTRLLLQSSLTPRCRMEIKLAEYLGLAPDPALTYALQAQGRAALRSAHATPRPLSCWPCPAEALCCDRAIRRTPPGQGQCQEEACSLCQHREQDGRLFLEAAVCPTSQ